MKIIIISFLIFCINFSFGQSKKEQIITLSSRFDSLSQLIDVERKSNAMRIENLDNQIRNLDIQINNNNAEFENKLTLLKNEINSKNKTIDSLKLLNVNRELYEERLVYVSNGNIYQKNIGNNDFQSNLLVSSGKVISIVAVKNDLYYAELYNNDLVIFRLNLRSLITDKFVLIKGENQEGYFSHFYDLNHRILEKGNNSIIISANYSDDIFRFRDHFVLDLYTKNYKKIDWNSEERFEKFDCINTVSFNSTNEIGSRFKAVKYGKEFELCLPLGDDTYKRITNTQFITPRECWEGEVDYIDYCYFQNGRILFRITHSCGDLTHSTLLLVNEDGSNQVLIDESYSQWYSHDSYYSLKDNSIYILIDNKIIIYQGKSNNGKTIAKDVSSFIIVNGI
jgi:hypothetical protein